MFPPALPTKAGITRDVVRSFTACLPAAWSSDVELEPQAGATTTGPDAIVSVRSPEGLSANFVIEVKRRIEPRMVPSVAEHVHLYCSALDESAVPVVGAGYISHRVRELLTSRGIGCVDTTGNIHLEVSSPGLFISTAGAGRDPWPARYPLTSLRGRGAGAAVRAIVDNHAPFGVRQLSEISGVPAPTLSRVIVLLDREGIVMRNPRGPVLEVDWQGAIRRWAEDYGQLSSNRPTMLLDPRGIRSIEQRLIGSPLTYAATGAFAAQRFNPVAPARTASLYVEDPIEAANKLNLREVDAGANVVLLEPFDPVVLSGVTTRDGLACVAPSQLAADLLTGPGREPSQGEAILDWMADNEPAWRT